MIGARRCLPEQRHEPIPPVAHLMLKGAPLGAGPRAILKRRILALRRLAVWVAFVDALGAHGFADPAPGKAAPRTLCGISHITPNIALQHCFSPNGRKRDEGSIAPLLCIAQNESWTITGLLIMPPSHLTM